MPEIDVSVPSRRYRIHVAPGVLGELGAITRGVAPADAALLVVDASITATHAPAARASLVAAGYAVTEVVVRAEEQRKRLDAVVAILEAAAAARLDRHAPFVALGGGIVGDVAGFAAASWLRGVPVVQAPTTLLAMVDASVGGKTGVNFPLPGGGLGKNLVGAFWQPVAVVADPRVLATLPERERRCGLAEAIKHAVIDDAEGFARLEADAARRRGLDEAALTALVARAVRTKVRIVESDEREAGARALLNLGHTFGHAIESIPALAVKHGEAVAIGMVAAVRLAAARGALAVADAERIVALLEAVGLPTRLPRAAPRAALVEAMGSDKKVARGRIRLILPVAIGRAMIVEDASAEEIAAAWREVGADA